MDTGGSSQIWRRPHLALTLTVALSFALTSAVSAQGPGAPVHIVEGPFQRDAEVVLISRIDGRIGIWDAATGTNTVDLNGRYSAWGGPYYDVVAGDFNGDGLSELAAIGGGPVNGRGPLLHTFDPVHYRAGTAQLPQLVQDISPQSWLMARAGDLDGDHLDEIVAIRTTSEGGITQRIQVFEVNPATGTWGSSPKWDLATAGGFIDVDVADFDADGKADIGLVRTGNRVLVLDGENPAISHFEAVVGGLADWSRIRIGDVEGNSNADLVLLRAVPVAAGNTPAAVVAIRPTSQTLWYEIFGWGFGDPPEDIEIADINGDGRLEIAALNTGIGAAVYTLNPRLGGANNNVSEVIAIGDSLFAANLVLGDANGDGLPERMIVRSDGSFLRILRYNANATHVDVVANGPFWDNFVAANLDGSGGTRAPQLQVPNEVNLFYIPSQARSTITTIAVRNAGSGTFDWLAIPSSCSWVGMSHTVGSAGQEITFAPSPAFLPSVTPGTFYTCSVGVQAASTQGAVLDNNQTIAVRLTVVGQLYEQRLPLVYD